MPCVRCNFEQRLHLNLAISKLTKNRTTIIEIERFVNCNQLSGNSAGRRYVTIGSN